MTIKTIEDINKMSLEQIDQAVEEARRAMFQQRMALFQQETQDSSMIRKYKKTVARLLSAKRHKQLEITVHA